MAKKDTVIIYGVNPVKEALTKDGSSVRKILAARAGSGRKKGRALEEIIRLAGGLRIPVERLSAAGLTRAAGTQKHQGIAAMVARDYEYASLEEILGEVERKREAGGRGVVLVLDSIVDPGNLGSLIRAALSAGAVGVVIPRDRACPLTPVVAKASAGAISHMRVARVTNLVRAIDKVKGRGLWAVALEADGEQDIYSVDLSGDTAIVIGSEGSGLRRLVREACDQCAAIPMAGPVGSLNAAQAGAIALFETLRQGRGK